MKDLVLHVPTGALLDFGDPEEQTVAIVQEWRRRGHKSRPRDGRRSDFQCWAHRESPNPDLYLRQQPNGVIVAAHWPGSGLHDRYSYGISDEHKRQTEYIRRAAETAGFRTEREYRLETGIRLDAAVFNGTEITDVEVQRCAISLPAILARTTRALKAGVVQVWYDENEGNARWMHQVPSVGMNRWPWDSTPPPRSVTATGLPRIRAVRCPQIRNGTCPDRWRGCNRFHPELEARAGETGLYVDDVAEMLPGGRLVSMRRPRARKRDGRDHDILLVSPEDKQLYEELTGCPADFTLRSATARPEPQPQQRERIICRRVAHPAARQLVEERPEPTAPAPRANRNGHPVTTRVTPWSTFDATLLVLNGWQWCAAQQTWFRTVGPDALSGACQTCRRRIRANPPPALHVPLSDRPI